MNKSELVDAVAEAADMNKATALKAVDAFIDAVKTSLHARKEVVLVGFGTFTTMAREARMGRNPKTGEPLKIAAAITAKFRAGKNLKDAVRLGGQPGQKPKTRK
ncbi:HU family DNA-binding protein [Pseudomonas sp. NPDC089408]|uniref:HU family DNA-binding protein n=1 Tax=Pseudomonas sp. NPDC089408 TaxID=3364465 RepID=UPI0038150369